MADLPALTEGIVLTHFIVSSDVAKSRQFYSDVLGGETLMDGEPTIVALANSWIIINTGGGPTDDKPTVTLEAPTDPDRVSAFLNIRVADIAAVHADWSARGAQFIAAGAFWMAGRVQREGQRKHPGCPDLACDPAGGPGSRTASTDHER